MEHGHGRARGAARRRLVAVPRGPARRLAQRRGRSAGPPDPRPLPRAARGTAGGGMRLSAAADRRRHRPLEQRPPARARAAAADRLCRPVRVRHAARRAGLPQQDHRRALGDQVRLPGHRRHVRLRLLHVQQCAAVPQTERGPVDGARLRQRTDGAADRAVDHAPQVVDDVVRRVAPRRLPFGRAVRFRDLPAGHGLGRLLPALRGRQLGHGDADGLPVRRHFPAGRAPG